MKSSSKLKSMNKLFGIWAVAVFTMVLPLDLTAAIELKNTEQPVLELFALVLGGIGIFLTGIHFAGTHLQKITGGTFRIHHLENQ